MKIVKQSVSLEWMTPDACQAIERAGRTCYKSEYKITAESARYFVEMILKRGHESVLEHASASFRIVCDRGVSHEIVRHRIASYSQESTRYCNYGSEKHGGEITVIEPPDLSYCNDIHCGECPGVRTLFMRCPGHAWNFAMRVLERTYLWMIEAKVSPQIARSVLPTCLKTEIVMTANFREWRHFLRLRTSPKAHPQMIEVATAIGDVLIKQCQACFVDVVDAQKGEPVR